MPVLESEDRIAPKSILRYRPIGDSNPPTGKRTVITNATTPMVPRASRLRQAEPRELVVEWVHEDADSNDDDVDDFDETEGTASPQSAHSARPAQSKLTGQRPVGTGTATGTTHLTRSAVPVPTHRRSAALKLKPRKAHLPGGSLFQPTSSAHSVHPLLYLGIGMLSMLILWTMLSAIFGWFTTTLDDLRYGRPRTFQTDAWVGHNEQTAMPSHFIATNLNGHIEVIEIPGGDASHSRIYVGPQLFGNKTDLVPVTLSFVDVNGDHKPDMILNFQGTHFVYINDQGGFRLVQPAERHQVDQFLQHLGQ